MSDQRQEPASDSNPYRLVWRGDGALLGVDRMQGRRGPSRNWIATLLLKQQHSPVLAAVCSPAWLSARQQPTRRDQPDLPLFTHHDQRALLTRVLIPALCFLLTEYDAARAEMNKYGWPSFYRRINHGERHARSQ